MLNYTSKQFGLFYSKTGGGSCLCCLWIEDNSLVFVSIDCSEHQWAAAVHYGCVVDAAGHPAHAPDLVPLDNSNRGVTSATSSVPELYLLDACQVTGTGQNNYKVTLLSSSWSPLHLLNADVSNGCYICIHKAHACVYRLLHPFFSFFMTRIDLTWRKSSDD